MEAFPLQEIRVKMKLSDFPDVFTDSFFQTAIRGHDLN